AGESGAAGLAGLLLACRDPRARAAIGLDAASHVILVNTESATDAASYAREVGASPEQVLATVDRGAGMPERPTRQEYEQGHEP
ncbi:MAG: hypothetical protein ABI330_16510, partial [Caldimonas sp.]